MTAKTTITDAQLSAALRSFADRRKSKGAEFTLTLSDRLDLLSRRTKRERREAAEAQIRRVDPTAEIHRLRVAAETFNKKER